MEQHEIYNELRELNDELSQDPKEWYRRFCQKYSDMDPNPDLANAAMLGMAQTKIEILMSKIASSIRIQATDNKMNTGYENKQLICDRLLECLYLTRQFYDLIDLDYIEKKELVVAHFEGGGKKEINVACDSGVAMIKDIIRGIGG